MCNKITITPISLITPITPAATSSPESYSLMRVQ